MSYMASYATMSRYRLSAVGLSELTLYLPNEKRASVFPSNASVIVSHFPESCVNIFEILNLIELDSQDPNLSCFSEHRLSFNSNRPWCNSVFVISPPSNEILNCLSTESFKYKSAYLKSTIVHTSYKGKTNRIVMDNISIYVVYRRLEVCHIGSLGNIIIVFRYICRHSTFP